MCWHRLVHILQKIYIQVHLISHLSETLNKITDIRSLTDSKQYVAHSKTTTPITPSMLEVKTASSSVWIYAGITLFTCSRVDVVRHFILTSPELCIFAYRKIQLISELWDRNGIAFYSFLLLYVTTILCFVPLSIGGVRLVRGRS